MYISTLDLPTLKKIAAFLFTFTVYLTLKLRLTLIRSAHKSVCGKKYDVTMVSKICDQIYFDKYIIKGKLKFRRYSKTDIRVFGVNVNQWF